MGVDGLTFIDYDHDGDLDLYACQRNSEDDQLAAAKSGTSAMWRNNGNGTFTDVTIIGVSIFTSAANAIGSDYNNDRAVDLVVADWTGGTVFQNPREGTLLRSTPSRRLRLTKPTPRIPTRATFQPSVLLPSTSTTTDGWILLSPASLQPALYAVAQQPRQGLRPCETA